MAILSGMVGWVSTAFSLPNATCPIHLWGEKNTPLGVITLGPRQAHWMRPWLTLVTRLRPSALPYRRIRVARYPLTRRAAPPLFAVHHSLFASLTSAFC